MKCQPGPLPTSGVVCTAPTRKFPTAVNARKAEEQHRLTGRNIHDNEHRSRKKRGALKKNALFIKMASGDQADTERTDVAAVAVCRYYRSGDERSKEEEAQPRRDPQRGTDRAEQATPAGVHAQGHDTQGRATSDFA